MTDHWMARADRVGDAVRWAGNPLVGLLAEDDGGNLVLPAWRNPHHDECPGGWWNRRFRPRNPLHWLPWLRSRLTRRIVWVEAL